MKISLLGLCLLFCASLPAADLGRWGNGKADATGPIQAAIDSQDDVDIPGGVYKLLAPLTLDSNTRIHGTGNVILKTFKPLAVAVQLQDGATNVSIEGVTLDFNLCHTGIKNRGSVDGLTFSNVVFQGSLPHTNYLVDLSDINGLTVEFCEFSQCLTAARVSGSEDTSVRWCRFTNWRRQAVHFHATKDIGTRRTDLSHLQFSDPAPGTVGAARQMITFYGDDELDRPMHFDIRLSDISCRGPGEPWNPRDENSRGTADQIVFHYSDGIEGKRVETVFGGEIGLTAARYTKHVTIEKLYSANNDAHGVQIGSADNSRFLLDTQDITLVDSVIENNCRRLDGKPDTQAQVHIQNAKGATVRDCKLNDTNTPRLAKCAVKVATSELADLQSNEVYFADVNGAIRYGIYSSTVWK